MSDWKKHPLFEVAEQEVVEVIPPELPDATEIKLADVRELMTLSWLRGVDFERERLKREKSLGESRPNTLIRL